MKKMHPRPASYAALYATASGDREGMHLFVAARRRSLRDYGRVDGYSGTREDVDEAESGGAS